MHTRDFETPRVEHHYTCRICGKPGMVLNSADLRMFRAEPVEHNACANAIGYTNADMGNSVIAGDMEAALHHYGRYLRAFDGNPDDDSWSMPTLNLK